LENDEASHGRLCEALEDLESAMEALGEVKDYLNGQVGIAPPAAMAAAAS
jgi:hypothetical protein